MISLEMQKATSQLKLGRESNPDLQQLKIGIVGAGILGTATALAFSTSAKLQISLFDTSRKQLDVSATALQKELGDAKDFSDAISFCFDLPEAIRDADYIAVCVPTPKSGELDQAYDYRIIDDVMGELIEKIKDKATILVRSTVDPYWLRKKSNEINNKIWYFPAFFREQSYLVESINSQNIIVGLPNFNPDVIKKAESLFSEFRCPKYFTTLESAALSKLFVNAFLATKISFFNEAGRAALECGVNPQEVANLISLDPRVGRYGSIVGKPFDGKCLPKDVMALLKLYDLKVISAAKKENDELSGQM